MISAMKEEWRRNRKAILVVDDDAATRGIITEALSDAGYENTRDVDCGKDALDLLETEGIDLVITDLKMPGMTGLDLLGHIKNIDPSVPVIMITAYPTIDLTVAAMKEGAVDFVTKPFRIEDLIFKVNLYLREKSILAENDKEERAANWNLNEKIRELSTIKLIGERIEKTRELSGDDIFLEIAKLALSVTKGERSFIALFDEATEQFFKKTFNGKETTDPDADSLPEGLKPLLAETAKNRLPMVLNGEKGLDDGESILAVPLMIRSKIFGVLVVLSDDHGTVFTRKDLSNLENLAERASLYVENTILYESLFGSIMNTFESLIHSVQVRDNYTERHSRSVTKLALMTAEIMGCSSYELESLRISSHLHDVGKIAIPDKILLKPGRLTEEEYHVITTHSQRGEEILMSIALFDQERKIVRHHHERWDGKGYPDRLSHDEIPFLARILSVADAFDAMTTDRPYRRKMPINRALMELKNNRWSQLDGDVVDAFLTAVPKALESNG